MTTPAPPATTMDRRLSLGDAVFIGMGSMIGAGIFAVWAAASATTPTPWLMLAVVIAALVAFCNATSSAQLAARYPVAGGTYVYGREELNPWWGFAAGWCFVIGKTASCAAMAMTFAGYVLPQGSSVWWQRLAGVAIVAVLTAVNCLGVTRTAMLTRVIVTIVLLTLGVFVGSMIGTRVVAAQEGPGSIVNVPELSAWGLLQSAALIFFAFAGYARIATMGEEVREPERTIPRAIVWALSLVVALYLLMAFVLWRIFPSYQGRRALPDWPLAQAAHDLVPWLALPLGIAAGLATAGALLNLMTGIGRTSLAMAREGDFPSMLAVVHPRTKVPHRAEILLGVVVAAVVLLADLRQAIGFSSFGVLLYYTVANLSAFRQGSGRRYPRALQVLGALLCIVLVATLPWQVTATGVAVLAGGLLLRIFATRTRAKPTPR